MTTNQEGVHAAVRAVTGTSRSYNEDWHALFDDEGIATGPFNARMLAWINASLSTSYSNLNEAMQAFAVDQGFANWASMNTFDVGSLADDLLGTETNGLAFYADDMSLVIRDTTTPANVFSGDANDKLTYASPSTKYILNQSGIYVPGATLRCEYDASGNPLGIRIEEARTNVVLHNRDLTNAVWTKSNATAAKDQTGIDGVANSASSLTATAGNATCLQAVTLASSARYQSAFVKRISGSGTIQMTMDNGTTWTTVTVTSSWAPVEIPTQTLANPTVGFRIVTSGDAIAVDVVDNENGTFRTSPIVTAGSTVTRAADNISIAASLFPYSATAGTLIMSWRAIGFGTSSILLSLSDGTANNLIEVLRASAILARLQVRTSGTFGVQSDAAITASGLNRAAAAWAANDFGISANGGSVVPDTTGAVPSVNVLGIGSRNSSVHANAHLASFVYLPSRVADGELPTRSAL